MTPDGRWIYFESHTVPCDDSSRSQLWRIASPVRADGSMQIFRPTTTSPLHASSLCGGAHPDNCPSAQNPCYLGSASTLLFNGFSDSYNSNTGSAGLFSIPATGGNPATVVLHPGQMAVNLPGTCYSAAAGRIAYSSDRPTAFSNTDNIWTSAPTATSSGEHQVTCYVNTVGTDLHAQEPSWSGDGKTIVYELADGNKPNVTTIWTIRANNNCLHPLAPTKIVPSGRCPSSTLPSDNHQPNWSPDGKHIVFQSSTSDGATTVNLWTVQPNGCGLTQVTKDPNSDTDASWSPDSRSIVYSTDLGAPTGVANLFIVNAVANGAKTRLTSQCYYDGAPSWSPDGNWVSFESWADPHNDNNDHPTSIWRIPATARPAAPKC
jgi:TolB protein